MSIKMFVADCDGVLTDGIYNVDEDGKISKNFYTRDFDALRQLVEAGIDVFIISSASDSVIVRKARHLSFMLEVRIGIIYKKLEMDNILKHYPDCSWENVAYIGDAENDIECIKAAGFSGCPSDAIEELKKTVLVNKDNYGILVNQYRYVDFLSKNPGGRGAVYDFAMEVLKRNNKGE